MEDRGNHLCFALKHTDNTSCILSMAIAVKSNFQKGCCHIGEVAKLMGHAKELVTVDIYGDNSYIIPEEIPELLAYMKDVMLPEGR